MDLHVCVLHGRLARGRGSIVRGQETKSLCVFESLSLDGMAEGFDFGHPFPRSLLLFVCTFRSMQFTIACLALNPWMHALHKGGTEGFPVKSKLYELAYKLNYEL